MGNDTLQAKAQLLLSRRQFLEIALAGVGVTGAAIAYQALNQKSFPVRIPNIESNDLPTDSNNPMAIVRDFDYGTVKQEKGRTIREYKIVAENSTVALDSAVNFNTWNFNNRTPGPTLRATQGDRLRVVFYNNAGHSHSMHFHGIHPAEADGLRPVRHGNATIYEFDAEPFGVQLYHCHTEPVTRHISKGMYGMLIIDPPKPRPPADEIVLVMGGYDTNDDNRNEFYAFNGQPNYYKTHPISIYQNQLIRLYLLNMIEFDPVATFHLHANFFQVYKTGRTLKPTEESDVISMGTAERHILEFTYKYPGKYMFHPHQDAIAQAGCMGLFDVRPAT